MPASRIARRSPPRARVNARTGAQLFFKCENLQRAGAFKFRGAYNALSRLSADERRRGVVAFSSGNHAQAVALAGQILDIPRVIVMPADAPAVKRRRPKGTAAKSSSTIATATTAKRSAGRSRTSAASTVIPPYDHPHIIAGQGTAARELLEDVGRSICSSSPAAAAACSPARALAAHALAPGCRVIGVEPARRRRCDAIVPHRGSCQTVHNPQTVADGARTPSLGSLTFPLVLDHVSDMVTVDDPALLGRCSSCGSGSSCSSSRPARSARRRRSRAGRRRRAARVGVILSGGNVDFSQVSTWVAQV